MALLTETTTEGGEIWAMGKRDKIDHEQLCGARNQANLKDYHALPFRSCMIVPRHRRVEDLKGIADLARL